MLPVSTALGTTRIVTYLLAARLLRWCFLQRLLLLPWTGFSFILALCHVSRSAEVWLASGPASLSVAPASASQHYHPALLLRSHPARSHRPRHFVPRRFLFHARAGPNQPLPGGSQTLCARPCIAAYYGGRPAGAGRRFESPARSLFGFGARIGGVNRLHHSCGGGGGGRNVERTGSEEVLTEVLQHCHRGMAGNCTWQFRLLNAIWYCYLGIRMSKARGQKTALKNHTF